MKILAAVILTSWLIGIIRLVVGLRACALESERRVSKVAAMESEEARVTWTNCRPSEHYEVGSLPSEQGRLSVFTELYEPPESTSLSEDTPYDSSSSSDY